MFGIIFGTICLLALLRVTFGWRHRRWGHHYYGHHHHGRRHFFLRGVFRRLDTGPGQEKLIMGEAQALRETMRGLRSELAASRAELAAVVRDEQFDRTKVDALFRKQDELLGKLRTSMTDSAEKVHGALDPRQKDQLASWLERGFGSYGYGC